MNTHSFMIKKLYMALSSLKNVLDPGSEGNPYLINRVSRSNKRAQSVRLGMRFGRNFA